MNAPDARMLDVGHARFDALSGELAIGGRAVRLRPRTAALLAHLVRHGGRVVTKDELMQAVWPDVVVTEDSIVQCVKEARHALGSDGRDWIRTVPRQGYAFVAPAPSPRRLRRGRIVATAAAIALATLLAALAWQFRPAAPPLAIAVLPIVNLTGDSAHEGTADDLTERLATAMWNLQTLKVIAPSVAFTYKGRAVDIRQLGRELVVRYVLEGSLRDQGGQAVLRLRLADTANANHLWSEDFAADDAAPDEVVARVGRSLGLQLAHVEADRSRREHADAPGATDLLNQARALMRHHPYDSDAGARARPLVEAALERDPHLLEGWVLLAHSYLGRLRWSATHEADLRRAADAAARALAVGPDVWAAHWVQAMVLLQQRRPQQALGAFDRALQLDRLGPGPLVGRATALIALGRPAEAIAPVEQAMRISPRDPQLAQWQVVRGVAELHLGNDAAAIDWLTRAANGQPESPSARWFLAGALGAAGHGDAAREQLARFRELQPGFSLRDFRAREVSDVPLFLAQRERLYAGLRTAGAAP